MRQALARITGGDTSPAAFAALWRAWGNPSHALAPDALARLWGLARACSGPALDLGSGLSSVVMKAAGLEVWALEDDGDRAGQIARHGVKVRLCPLVDGFYAIPADLPAAFGLVLVDGPQDLAGRARAYDLLADRIAGAIVIADDIFMPRIARGFDAWVLRSGRVAERFGNYGVA